MTAMSTRKSRRSGHDPAAAAAEDLAESRRRASEARTPIAKLTTKAVVAAKEQAYSGKLPRETPSAPARVKRATPKPAAVKRASAKPRKAR